MNTQHTPGPWRFHPNSGPAVFYIGRPLDGYPIRIGPQKGEPALPDVREARETAHAVLAALRAVSDVLADRYHDNDPAGSERG